MKNICEFKKGDVITRIIPAKELPGIFGGRGIGDRSYIGEPFIFVGIANGCIYIKRALKVDILEFGDKLMDLKMDIFSEGWDYYIDPLSLLTDIDDVIIISKEQLEDQLEKALEDENYELASVLKEKLNNNK